ncbi:MAG: HD domain-containing protein [Oligoflexia bacterium]|nr:HD domain-containing protein [Oligoflexia bacterium]
MKNNKKETQIQMLKKNIQILQDEQEDRESVIFTLNTKIKRYNNLVKFSEIISSAAQAKRADKEVYKKGVAKLKELIECENVKIYRVDKEKQEVFYEIKTVSNDRGGDRDKLRVSYKIDEESIPGACAYYMAILHIPDVTTDSRNKKSEFEDETQAIKYRDMLLAPLVVEGELLGIIQAINSTKGSFNKEDIQFIQTVSNQMSIILQYVSAVEKAKKQLFQLSNAFAMAIDKKDRYTGGHTKRVAHFSEVIGREMNLSKKELDDLRLAGVLHDVGKIGIDDNILKKRAPLSKEEFDVMKEHPRLGHEIIGNIEGLKTVVDGIRFHHERPDGKGYPYGIKGNDISILAQIISVADTFDAIISDRPYRKGLPPMRAYREIVQYRGRQFSEEVVDAFESVFKKSHMYKENERDFEPVTKLEDDANEKQNTVIEVNAGAGAGAGAGVGGAVGVKDQKRKVG